MWAAVWASRSQITGEGTDMRPRIAPRWAGFPIRPGRFEKPSSRILTRSRGTDRFVALLLSGTAQLVSFVGTRSSPMVQLLTWLWLFNPSQPALSTLTAQAPQAEFAVPANAGNSFTVKFTVDLKKFEGEKNMLEIPNVLRVRLRQHGPRDRNRQNYPAFKMPDGSVPVLEADVVLHSVEHPDWKNMTIGIPLALLKKPEGEHEVVLNFTGVRWTMYVDGQLLDNDFPFGYPQWADKNTWKLDAEYVRQAAIYLPAIEPEKKPAMTPDTSPGIQYWTPARTQQLGRGCRHVFPQRTLSRLLSVRSPPSPKQVRARCALLRTPLHPGFPDVDRA